MRGSEASLGQYQQLELANPVGPCLLDRRLILSLPPPRGPVSGASLLPVPSAGVMAAYSFSLVSWSRFALRALADSRLRAILARASGGREAAELAVAAVLVSGLWLG